MASSFSFRVSALLLLAMYVPVAAQQQFWDGANTTPNGMVDGGAGTWDTTTTNWTNNAGDANSAWVDGSTAVFAGAAGTVTIPNGVQHEVGGLDFQTNGYLVQSIFPSGTGQLGLTGNVEFHAAPGVSGAMFVNLTGTGGFTKTGAGTIELRRSASTFSGDVHLNEGELWASAPFGLGNGTNRIIFDGGTLRRVNGGTLSQDVTIEDGGGTINAFFASINYRFTGDFDGTGQLTVDGLGGFTELFGTGTWSGGTIITPTGTLKQLSATALPDNTSYAVNGTLELNHDLSVSELSGSGNVLLFGGVALTIDQDTDGGYSGSTILFSGGNSLVKDGTGAFNHAGGIAEAAGASSIVVNNGTLELSAAGGNSYSGGTTVNGGTLKVSNTTGTATGSGTVQVNSGGTLAGTGQISGAVTIADGGTLAPGNSPGTLRLLNNLVLNNASNLDYELDTPGTVGMGVNDLVTVGGDLTLDGNLNITDAGNFGAGTYRLFDYTGSLTDNDLLFGIIPAGFDVMADTSTANQVNLTVTSTGEIYWDGANTSPNGMVDGGTGTWDGTMTNWTTSSGNANSLWADGLDAIFSGTGGTITLADGFTATAGSYDFQSNGYTIQADSGGAGTGQLSLTGTTNVDVGTGLSATIEAVIGGTGNLRKRDDGTLILSGANTYGNTIINAGTLQVGNGGATGTLGTGDVTNNGVLAFNRTGTLTVAGDISGTGRLSQDGPGTTVLSGTNTYSGRTQVNDGILEVTGSITQTGRLTVNAANTTGAALNIDGGSVAVAPGSPQRSIIGDTAAPMSGGMAVASELNITNGGTLTVGTGTLSTVIGRQANSSGRVSIEGAGSSWQTSRGIIVGEDGQGYLEVLDGGEIEYAAGGGSLFNLAINAGSEGYVLVDGAGSSISHTQPVNAVVGNRGDGTLTLSNGGTVSFLLSGSSEIKLANFAGSTGTLNIGADPNVAGPAAAPGIVSVPVVDGGDGTAVINFNHTGTDYAFTSDGTSGGSAVTITGSTTVNQLAGTTALSGENTYTGNTTVQAGTLDLDGGKITSPGATLTVGDGTNASATFSIQNGGTAEFNSGVIGNAQFQLSQVTVDGMTSSLQMGTTKIAEVGRGQLTVTNGATVTTTGGAEIAKDGFGGAFVSGPGSVWDVTGGFTLGVNGGGIVTLTDGGKLSSATKLELATGTSGGGNVTIIGTSTAGILDAPEINGVNVASLTFNHGQTDYAFTRDGTSAGTGVLISGTTGVTHNGEGTTEIVNANTYTGPTQLNDGLFLVNNTTGSATGTGTVTVQIDGTLGGSGFIDGPVEVFNSATLAPGNSAGTLSINNNLRLSNGIFLDFELDTAGVVGSGVNDLISVDGDLILDGILNVTALSNFGDGTYRLFDYTGSLTDNDLALGTLPVLFDYTLDTATNGQVDLIVAAALAQFWDGANTSPNGMVDGGTGTWDGAMTNWTNTDGTVNAVWQGDVVAAFGGTAGTVTIADGFAANPDGMLFQTDGYTIAATGTGSLTFAAATTIEVMTGTATISAAITGAGGPTKTGTGKLVLTGNNTYSGSTVVEQGILSVESGGSISHSGSPLVVSVNPAAELAIKGTSTVTSGLLFLGRENGSMGTLNISDGGFLSTNGAFVGLDVGSQGEATVSGAGSQWDNTTGLIVGSRGTAKLTISDGGVVRTQTISIGASSDASAEVLVTGANSHLEVTGATFQIGNIEGASLTVAEGGRASSRNGTDNILVTTGFNATSSVNIGAGGGAGVLNASEVQGGGNFTSELNFNHNEADYFFTNTGLTGGTEVLITNNLEVNHLGAGKTTLRGTNTYNSGTNVKMGTLVLDGGSITHNSADVVVGDTAGDDGTFVVQNGGVVSNRNGVLGRDAGSLGEATVTGSGSHWNHGGEFIVGAVGGGTLNIEDGGVVSNNIGTLGFASGSMGMATVTGSGSQWNTTTDFLVGLGGDGLLQVENGGVVSNDSSIVGTNAGSQGMVTVAGSGSQWNNTQDLIVGNSGLGMLYVLSGGGVTSTDAVLGDTTTGNGQAKVTGANSQWNNTGVFIVGNNGMGTLTVADGGQVSVGSGSGTLILANITGSMGTLNIGTNPASADPLTAAGIINTAGVTTGDGTGTINFNHTSPDYFFTNDGTNAGTGVAINGTTTVNHLNGMTTLNAASTYTGPTNITGGTLVAADMNALGAGHVNVNTAGTLAVQGIVQVGGNFNLGAGGILVVDVNSPDQISVTGNANIQDGALVATGTLERGAEKLVIEADGTLSGTLAAFVVPVGAVVEQTDQQLLLIGGSDPSAIIAAATTPNEKAVADMLAPLFSETVAPDLEEVLNTFEILAATGQTDQIRLGFNQISPAGLGTIKRMAFAYSNAQFRNMQRRGAELRAGFRGASTQGLTFFDRNGRMRPGAFPAIAGATMDAEAISILGIDAKTFEAQQDNRWGFFANGSGQFGDVDGGDNLPGYDFDSAGMTMGIDYRHSRTFVLGFAVGYAGSEADVDSWGSEVDVDSARFGLYATWFDRDFEFTGEGWYVDAYAGGAYNSYTTDRAITFGGLNRTATGETEGLQVDASLIGGYDIQLGGGFVLSPYTGVQYTRVDIDGYTESGAQSLNLTVNDTDADSLRSNLGIVLGWSGKAGGITWRPEVRAAWQHEFLDGVQTVNSRFASGAAAAFVTELGNDAPRDTALVGASLNADITETTSAFLSYDAEVNADYLTHSINGGFSIRF